MAWLGCPLQWTWMDDGMKWNGMGGLGLGSYIDLLRHVSATQRSHRHGSRPLFSEYIKKHSIFCNYRITAILFLTRTIGSPLVRFVSLGLTWMGGFCACYPFVHFLKTSLNDCKAGIIVKPLGKNLMPKKRLSDILSPTPTMFHCVSQYARVSTRR